jgi:hypothetical protein
MSPECHGLVPWYLRSLLQQSGLHALLPFLERLKQMVLRWNLEQASRQDAVDLR